MAANDTNRPEKRGGANDEKANDSARGENAKIGFPGKLQRARTTAPEGASDDEINNVGWVAHERNCDPADVWRERENQSLGEEA